MSDFRKVSSLDGMETLAGGSEHDDKVEILRVQDVEPYLERNKASYNAMGFSNDMQRVASIPLVVVEAWMKEGIDIFDPGSAEEVRRRLNDPSWRHLRTAPGRV